MRKLVLEDKKCEECGKMFGRETCRQVSDFKEKKYCSHKCYTEAKKGKNHWNWNGGVKTRPDGYMRDSKTDQYIHRIVMSKHIGRALKNEEHIHHIDGNPKNNSISNLLLVSNSQHRKIENQYASRDEKGRYSKKEGVSHGV
jgi:hypothetical protein